jgi:hypothetical protein
MLIFLFIILGLVFCLFTFFLFSLVKAGRRADKDEEKFLDILSTSINNSEKSANVIEIKYQEKIYQEKIHT